MNQRARASAPFHDHRGLIVWQKAIDLAVEVNSISDVLPAKERYGMAQQMRAAAVAIAANIAKARGATNRETSRAF